MAGHEHLSILSATTTCRVPQIGQERQHRPTHSVRPALSHLHRPTPPRLVDVSIEHTEVVHVVALLALAVPAARRRSWWTPSLLSPQLPPTHLLWGLSFTTDAAVAAAHDAQRAPDDT